MRVIGRAWCVIITAFLSGAAFAGGVREKAIGIDFPERLGEFTLKGRNQFPKAGEGAVILYESPDVRGNVYVYNAGLAAIPNGVGSPAVHMHFLETGAALQKAAAGSAGKVKQVKLKTISAFPGCGPQFLWRADEIAMDGGSVVSRTYLTGLDDNFVKLRVTHPRDQAGAADEFVQQVRRLLGRCNRAP